MRLKYQQYFFRFVTKHAYDRQTDGETDRITTPKTVLALLRRAAKMEFCFALLLFCVPGSFV